MTTKLSDCVFCKIVAGRVDADLVASDESSIAFLDKSPLFHGHTLVVPRRHVETLPDLARLEIGPFFEFVQLIASAMPSALGAQGTFVANNNIVSQSVAHLHVHVIPRTKGDGLRGFFWPRTRYEVGEAELVATKLAESVEAMRSP
jgi:histidine triad (HIT) family protein